MGEADVNANRGFVEIIWGEGHDIVRGHLLSRVSVGVVDALLAVPNAVASRIELS